MITPWSDDVACLDIEDTSKGRPADNQVMLLIKEKTGVTNSSAFQQLPEETKRSVLIELKGMRASLRQLERCLCRRGDVENMPQDMTEKTKWLSERGCLPEMESIECGGKPFDFLASRQRRLEKIVNDIWSISGIKEKYYYDRGTERTDLDEVSRSLQ